MQKNANLGRDLSISEFHDIASVQEGDRCPQCGSELRFARGMEVGHIFKLGTAYTELLHAYYLDQHGVSRPIVMGCYGIGSGRLLAAAVEQHHDDKGILWPMPIAPFHVHLVGLGLADAALLSVAEQTYSNLAAAGVEVLYDDREEPQAGVKFNDADLIGIPLRVTLSPRSIKAGGVEIKRRGAPETAIVPVNSLVAELRRRIEHWQA